MKIAYLSNIKEKTGYSDAARGYLQALRTTDIDVSLRNIRLTGETQNEIYEEENNDLNNIDICLMHSIPTNFNKTSSKKNVGIFAWETTKLPESWIKNINRNLDAAIVSNEAEKDIFKEQISIPIYCVPYVFDISPIENAKGGIKCNLVNEDTHIFYTIGSYNKRKNYEDLLLSYFSEFREHDNVLLYVHLSDSGFDSEFKSMAEHIKSGLKINDYSKVLVTSGHVSYDRILNIHYSCNTYISLSHGESWNLPLFHAYCLGNDVISSRCFGPMDYICEDECFVDSVFSPVFGMTRHPDGLYVGDGNWIDISILSARKAMRTATDNKTDEQILRNEIIDKYSPSAVGEILKGVFEEIIK